MNHDEDFLACPYCGSAIDEDTVICVMCGNLVQFEEDVDEFMTGDIPEEYMVDTTNPVVLY